MLNKETEEKLKVLGFDVSKLTEAIKAEDEQSLEVPKLFTESQNLDFGKNRFDEGKNAMGEILAKDIKKNFNIESDSKDVNEVVKLYGENVLSAANIKPDEKYNNLEKDYKEIQGKLEKSMESNSNLEKEYKTRLFGVQTKTKISSLIPEKTKIPKEDITTLFLNNYSVDTDEEGRTVVKKGNEILKDGVLNPLSLETVLNTFLDERKYVEKSGMNGGDRGAGGSSKFKNISEFNAYCEKNNIEPMGAEGQALLSKNKEANFDYKT